MKKIFLFYWLIIGVIVVHAKTINIVAAENFYGKLAQEIGGKYVNVQSIINNPDADPHLFTTSPSTIKAIMKAQIIIYNGADYDNWMNQMISEIDQSKVTLINVANLVGVKSGQNPHLWYKNDTFPLLANLLADTIINMNHESSKEVNKNLAIFIKDHEKILNKINDIKSKYANTAVTATEPVYGYMAEAMGLDMKGLDFQWAVMNDIEPTPKSVANYQVLLKDKKVKILFYNSQVSNAITNSMQALAKKNNIPIVGITETMPDNLTVNKWLLFQIQATADALSQIN